MEAIKLNLSIRMEKSRLDKKSNSGPPLSTDCYIPIELSESTPRQV